MDHPAERFGQQRLPISPLVGRTNERLFLRDQLAAALQGHGRLVLIGGEAGIGKTTLVKDLSREAVARGALVLTGHCYDLSSTPPYGPWLDLGARYSPMGNLPALPPALAGDGLEEIRSQAALFAQARAFLTALASEQPALVVLEDLHWSDPASLELLRYLAAQIETLRLLIVVTYRIDEAAANQLFYRQLPALVRDADGLRLDLRRLEVEDLRKLVTSRWRLPEADEDRLVGYLKRHADYLLSRQVTEILGQLGRHRDEPELAWAQIRSILPRGPATEPGGCVFADALLCQRLAADLHLDRGDLAGALVWLTANDRWLDWNGSVLGRADNRVVWARYHRQAGDIERARDCAAEAFRAASEPDQPLTRLAAHRHPSPERD